MFDAGNSNDNHTDINIMATTNRSNGTKMVLTLMLLRRTSDCAV